MFMKMYEPSIGSFGKHANAYYDVYSISVHHGIYPSGRMVVKAPMALGTRLVTGDLVFMQNVPAVAAADRVYKMAPEFKWFVSRL